MKILNLIQGSQDWIDYRRISVTGTDMSVICANKGLCKNLFYKKTDALIADKISGKRIPSNKYFDLGKRLEPIILNSFNFISIVTSEVCSLDGYPRIITSLDARDDLLDIILEVKSTSKPIEKIDQLVSYYSFQVAHSCHILGYKAGYLLFGFCENFELKEIKQVEIIAQDVIKYDDWFRLCEEFLILLDLEGKNEHTFY